jgi:uncharacterized protein YciI
LTRILEGPPIEALPVMPITRGPKAVPDLKELQSRRWRIAMRYVAILDAGPAWIEGKTVHEQDRNVMTAHLHAMRKKYERGCVLFGGPFRSDDGGIVLIEAAGRLEAKELMDCDPAIAAGIMDYNLFEVRRYFDAFSGDAWSPKKEA